MSSALFRIGRSAARHPWRVIGAWALVAVVVVAASTMLGRDLEDTFEVPGVDSERALDLLSSAGSDRAGSSARVVATPSEPGTTFFDDDGARRDLAAVRDRLVRLGGALAVADPVAMLTDDPDAAVASGLVSPDGRVALLDVRYREISELDARDLDELRTALTEVRAGSSLQVEAGGDLFFTFDEPETGPGEVGGLLVAVVVLLVAFGSVVAMGLPIGMALFGLALGVSAMSLLAWVIEVPSWAPEIAGMIGLGVGIDYALFLVTRHRDFLHRGIAVADAAGRAVATAGQAVVFAGGTVVIAILGLGVAGIPFLTAAGVAVSVVVAVMVVASVTLLPAFLGLAGHGIDRFGIHRGGRGSGVGARWTRWGRHVSRHAWPYALGVTGVLLALTAPVLALDLGSPDEGSAPGSRTQRRAYDLVAEGFGPGANGPLLIVVDLAGEPAIVDPLVGAIVADPGVESVASPIVDDAAGIATIVAQPTTAPQDDATFATVERLRAEVLPVVVGDGPASAHVGGSTANVGDVAGRVTDRLPLFVGSVVALSFVLLMLVFRSILVPLKAALLNLLSIGAAYGVLVMVFQWGWGEELIGLESTVPIVSFVPMFMFAIVFGLSMDYEVFLLSRVREEYVASGDNDGAVIAGLAGTARVITSAALIMISVFGGFVLGDDPTTKMFGLGLAVAIAVDATIVRVVLVPATMTLMGDANWWLPAWLDRLLPHVDVDGAAASALDVDPTVVAPSGIGSAGIGPDVAATSTSPDDATPIDPTHDRVVVR
ncbi:MMPL family transporter [Ilumatobacter sp.]|uniref:MMPL family transporter n=1 Tax=Ilumatobacter sp. TaxID=1967498 RepID=UPI003B51FE4B